MYKYKQQVNSETHYDLTFAFSAPPKKNNWRKVYERERERESLCCVCVVQEPERKVAKCGFDFFTWKKDVIRKLWSHKVISRGGGAPKD